MLRQNIEAYIKQENLQSDQPLIDKDSSRVGERMRISEKFLEKFQHQIHNWLLKELPQPDNDSVYAASLSVGNGSNRPGSLLGTASRLVRSALRRNLSL